MERSRLTSPPDKFRSSYFSQFSKLRRDILTTYARILALGTSGSAAVGVEGGIEILPKTGNGQKIIFLPVWQHFLYFFGFFFSKSKRRFDEVETSPRRPARSFQTQN